MFERDLALDVNGNSIIKGGDFVLTKGDKEFISNMLTTNPGSWKLHDDLGVGLFQFVGEQVSEKLYTDMRYAIISFFKNYMLYPKVDVFKLGSDSVACLLDFTTIDGEDGKTSFNIAFNIETGGIRLIEDETQKVVSVPENTRVAVNKYITRRR